MLTKMGKLEKKLKAKCLFGNGRKGKKTVMQGLHEEVYQEAEIGNGGIGRWQTGKV